MATLASLAIDLTANSAKMVSELNKANGHLTGFAKQAEAAGKLIKVGFAAATSGLFAAMVKESIDAGAELTRFSRIANTSTDEFQRLAAASRRFGVDQDKLSDILKDTTDKIGDFIATGGGGAIDFFENIAPVVGVTAEEFKNLSGAQALGLYVESLKKANVSQAEFTFYMEAIASDATALIPIFDQSSEAAKRLSVILTDVELENLQNAKVAIDDATSAIGRLTDKMVAGLAPAIESAANKLVSLFATMASEGNSVAVLEKRIADLNASLLNVRGRSAAALKDGIVKQIEELQNQLTAAKALAGDMAALEASRLTTSQKLLDLQTKLKEVEGVGRSAEARRNGYREEIQILTDYQAKLVEVANTKAATTDSPDFGGANRDLEAIMGGAIGDSLFGFTGGQDPLARILGASPDETIARLESQLETESEAILSAYVERQETLAAYLQQNAGFEEKYNQLSLRNLDKYNKAKLALEKKTNQQVWTDDQLLQRKTLSATAAFFGVMASENKAFATGQALINTYLGVSESLAAYPMPLAAIMAATHFAAGMKQVSAIRSGGSGGGVSASTSIGSISGLDGPESFIEQTQTFGQEEKRTTIDVNLNVDDDALLNKSQLASIMRQINDAAENRNIRINL